MKSRGYARARPASFGKNHPRGRRQGLLALLLIYAQRLAHWSLRSPVVEYALNEFKEVNAIYNLLMGFSCYLR